MTPEERQALGFRAVATGLEWGEGWRVLSVGADGEHVISEPARVHHVEILRSAWGVDEPFLFFSDDEHDFVCARGALPDLSDEPTLGAFEAQLRERHGNPALCLTSAIIDGQVRWRMSEPGPGNVLLHAGPIEYQPSRAEALVVFAEWLQAREPVSDRSS